MQPRNPYRHLQRYEEFCRLYASTNSADEASKACGYTPSTGRRLLRYPHIDKRIRELKKIMLKAHDITAARVMRELARVGFSDIRTIYDADGRLKNIKDLDDDAAAAVSAVETETRMEKAGMTLDLATGEMVPKWVEVTVNKVKRYDKNTALTVLAKHFKIIGDEGDGVNALASALADRLKLARKRVDPLPAPTLTLENDA